MRAEVCFDAATEGATGGMLGLLPTRRCGKAKGRDTPIEGVRRASGMLGPTPILTRAAPRTRGSRPPHRLQGAQIAAVDLRLDSTGVTGPDAQRVASLESSRETGLGASLVGDRAVGPDLQPRGGATYAHRRSEAVLGALLWPCSVFAVRVRARRFEKRRRQRVGRLCEQAVVAVVKGTVDDQEERQHHEYGLPRVQHLE